MLLLPRQAARSAPSAAAASKAAVKQRAAGLARQGRRRGLRRFVLDHDPEWADGLICGGRMVGPRRVPREGRATWPTLTGPIRRLLEAGRGFTEAIALDPEPDPASRSASDTSSTTTAHAVRLALAADLPDAEAIFRRRSSRWRPALVRPRKRGPGLPADDASGPPGDRRGRSRRAGRCRPGISRRLRRLGRRRPPRVRPPSSGSPGPMRRLVVGPIGRHPPRAGDWTPQTYALIVTRGHGHDQEALSILLAPTAAPYVGLIGSRRKIKLILREPCATKGSPTRPWPGWRRRWAWISARRAVEEIAVSIVAELIARRNLPPAPR